MRRVAPICLCLLALLADPVAAERASQDDLAELGSRLARPSIDDRLAAVEGLLAWSLSSREPGHAMSLLVRATHDRSPEVAMQAAHALGLLEARRPEIEGRPLSAEERASSRARRQAAQRRDLEVWRERLANGTPEDRLQAVKALAAHALVGSHLEEALDLIELSTSDRNLAVAAQARAALEQLEERGAAPGPTR